MGVKQVPWELKTCKFWDPELFYFSTPDPPGFRPPGVNPKSQEFVFIPDYITLFLFFSAPGLQKGVFLACFSDSAISKMGWVKNYDRGVFLWRQIEFFPSKRVFLKNKLKKFSLFGPPISNMDFPLQKISIGPFSTLKYRHQSIRCTEINITSPN